MRRRWRRLRLRWHRRRGHRGQVARQLCPTCIAIMFGVPVRVIMGRNSETFVSASDALEERRRWLAERLDERAREVEPHDDWLALYRKDGELLELEDREVEP